MVSVRYSALLSDFKESIFLLVVGSLCILTKLCMQAENIKFTLEQQMVFFARLVGKFTVADDITPIKVYNLD